MSGPTQGIGMSGVSTAHCATMYSVLSDTRYRAGGRVYVPCTVRCLRKSRIRGFLRWCRPSGGSRTWAGGYRVSGLRWFMPTGRGSRASYLPLAPLIKPRPLLLARLYPTITAHRGQGAAFWSGGSFLVATRGGESDLIFDVEGCTFLQSWSLVYQGAF